MLTITSLDEFRSKVAHKEEIRESEIAPGLISFCYMISAENTFDDAWSRECRGIVFNKATGEVVGRALHKFFNVNEREETRVENLYDREIVRLMDKRDGSMIHTVKVGTSYRLKSKKSFESDVAKMATEWIRLNENKNFDTMCQVLAQENHTVIFEYTAPDARIVLPYSAPELRVLHIRDNDTGEYWSKDEIEEVCNLFTVKSVDESDMREVYDRGFDIDMLIEEANIAENIEGWVLQFDNGDMVKLKCDWYLKRHRAMTFLRERDIAVLVLDEGLDDLKSMMVGDGVDITEIIQIENRVVSALRFLARDVENILLLDSNLDRKTFAIKYKDHEHFGLLMSAYTGKEPDYKGYFERNILKEQYGLRQLNLLNSSAEPD